VIIPNNLKRWLKKRKGKIAEYFTITLWVALTIITIILYCFGYVGLSDLLGVIIALLVITLSALYIQSKQKRQTMLISFTSKYLLEKEESYMDEILGMLISGKLEKLKIDPIEEFFKCIKGICLKGDFEMRRRISEALPALFKIDLEESKDLVGILRRDWDEEWKSDNRRRTIEALPYIISKEKEFVRENLHIIDGDEIFAIIAMVEVLDVWKEKINKKEAEKLFTELKNEMEEQQYGLNEINASTELWNLLHLIHSDPNQAIKRSEELKDHSNIYIQICIARNLKHLCKRFPERILNLMDYFMEEDKHKNVRRPIAKEDSVECLISLLQDRRLSEKAKETLWKLINDEDDIIRLATFDKIEKILDIDNEFGIKVLKHVVERNRHPKLVERAETLLRRDKN